ncbi:MAG: hypothetical protein U0165_03020 [Polyangiaceae bacterium]
MSTALGVATPKILVSELARDEIVLGAYQRAATAIAVDRALSAGYSITRRCSGGPSVFASRGSLHVVLSLPRADALTDATPSKLVNRYVRPLLRALSSLGLPAHYFGRDWVSIDKRPVAWVGFAHRRETGACVFEAIVPVDAAFALPRGLDAYSPRSSDPFLGKAPASLSEISRAWVDRASIIAKIYEAYEHAYGPIERGAWDPSVLRSEESSLDARFSALREEVIGFVGASYEGDSICLGGDLFASEGLLEEFAIDCEGEREALAQRWLDRISETGAVLDGVRQIESLVDVCLAVKTRRAPGLADALESTRVCWC